MFVIKQYLLAMTELFNKRIHCYYDYMHKTCIQTRQARISACIGERLMDSHP